MTNFDLLTTTTLPDIVIHCDWSTDISKRVYARAERDGGHYVIKAVDLIGRYPQAPLDFRMSDRQNADKRRFVGFDVPFGIPIKYAEQAGIGRFIDWLPRLGKGAWNTFYEPAAEQQEISIYRPFYPARPGGTKRQDLLDGLGLEKNADLLRICDRANPNRGAASPLFWTLGAQQVGKAAITVWRDVLVPLLTETEDGLDLVLWPFEGKLQTLLEQHQIVAAEVYPAEMYHHLQLSFGRGESKRRVADRLKQVEPLLSFIETQKIGLEPLVAADLKAGFGENPNGEDAFDAFVGLLGMLGVLDGVIPVGEQRDQKIREIEGAILGDVRVE
ncbi:MAG: DUF429 domain-containing protein [Chloroflexota bacterium]